MIDLSTRENTELLERYRPIPISYLLRYSILKRIKSGEEILDGIDGREHVKEDVVRALLSGAQPYLVSEEGTGKTRLARSISRPAASGAEDQGLPVQRRPEMAEDPPLPAMPGEREPDCRVRGRVDKRPGEVLADSGKRVHQRGKTPGLKGHSGNSAGHEPERPARLRRNGRLQGEQGRALHRRAARDQDKGAGPAPPDHRGEEGDTRGIQLGVSPRPHCRIDGEPRRVFSRERGAEAAPRQAGDRLHGPARRGRGVFHHDDGALRGKRRRRP